MIKKPLEWIVLCLQLCLEKYNYYILILKSTQKYFLPYFKAYLSYRKVSLINSGRKDSLWTFLTCSVSLLQWVGVNQLSVALAFLILDLCSVVPYLSLHVPCLYLPHLSLTLLPDWLIHKGFPKPRRRQIKEVLMVFKYICQSNRMCF